MRVVRLKSSESIEAMTVLCKDAYDSEGGFSRHVRVDVPYASRNYADMVAKGVAVVFGLIPDEGHRLVGGLGAVKVPDIHCGELTAVETFWFTLPEYRGHGLRLFKAFETWALKEGCKRLAMIHLEDSMPERLSEFYRRRGYELVESHYVREVTQ